jgi:hypothetical protein
MTPSCGCGCKSSGKCAVDCGDSPRRWLSRQKFKVTRESPALDLKVNECLAADSDDMPDLYIRRRGQDNWLLRYPAFEMNDDGAFRFIFDSKYYTLPTGRYEAQVRVGCKICGSVEIDLTDKCRLSKTAGSMLEPFQPLIHSMEPPGVTDIFTDVSQFKAVTCAIVEPSDTTLPLKPADALKLCQAVLCRPVQLVLYDSTKQEVVEFAGCVDGVPVVTRGVDGACRRFPSGAVIQFSWTEGNVVAACEGCV